MLVSAGRAPGTDDPADAGRLERHDAVEPDGADAEDQGGVVRAHARQVHRVQRDGQRLGVRAEFQRHVVVQGK
jgi:hypothetical protein